MRKIITICCLLFAGISATHAQFSLTAIGTAATEDFQTFEGTGCSPTPITGQLDSKTFAIFGCTNGTGAATVPNDLPFNDTAFVGDLARGYRYNPVTIAGLYAYHDTTGGNTNRMMWIQPTGADLTPGAIWTRVVNNTGVTLTDVQFDFDFVYFNDGTRSQSIAFEYSTDSVNFMPLYGDTTITAPDGVLYTTPLSYTVSGLSLANGQTLFFRWTTNDKAGNGARDEMGFDNISVTALPVSTVAAVSFVGTAGTVAENGGIYNVDISQNIAAACSVDVTVSGTATGGGVDFSYNSLVVFDGISASVSLPFTIVDDILIEPSENITMTLANPIGNCTVSAGTYTLTIIDDDTPSEIDFPISAANIGEGAGTANLFLTQSYAKPCSVEVALIGGTAVNPADFTYTSPQLIVFDGITTTSPSIAIPIIDDALVEGGETAIFALANPSAGCALGAVDTLTITIQDNDFPLYNIAPVTTVDANGNPDSLNVVCRLTGVVHGVNYRAALNGLQFVIADTTGSIWLFNQNKQFGYTVTEGDLVGVQGTIIQAAGTTQMRIDTIVVLGSGQPLMPITNITAPFTEPNEADLLKITMVKFVNPAAWTTTPPPNAGGFTMQATDNVNTWDVRIDNDVDLYDNALAPTCKWMTITGLLQQFDQAAPFTTGYRLACRYQSDIVCMPDPIVAITSNTTSVLESVGSFTVSVDITNPNPDTTSVTITTSGTATAGTDYTFTPTTVKFPGNSSATIPVTITVVNDGVLEPAETVILTLTNPTNNATISSSSVTVTIEDTGVAITPSLAKEAISLYPNPGKESFTIRTSEKVTNIKVYNTLGQLVTETTATTVPTNALNAGIYHIQVETTNGVWNSKWVKE